MIEDLYKKELFTNTEYDVVSYMIQHHNILVDMTITELAKNANTSNTTIIRICRKIGYDGFKEFKKEYIKYIESRKYIFQNFDYTVPFQKNQNTMQVIASMSSLYKHSIDNINKNLNMSDLEKIIDILSSSHQIILFGKGDSKITAESFMNRLVKIGIFTHLATLFEEELFYARHAGDDDCCVFITYDKTNTYNRIFKELIHKKTKIIVITAYKDHPLVKYSDASIIIPHLEEDDKIATFYSQHAFQYVLNIIYSLLYQKR